MSEKIPDFTPDENLAQERKPAPEFPPNIGLDRLIDALASMHEEGISLEGSSRSYDPIELARGINDVVLAATQRVKDHDSALATTMANHLATSDNQTSVEISALEELTSITRTNGLREAVLNAVQELCNDFSRRFPRQYLPISLYAHSLFEELTGHTLGKPWD